MFCAQHLSNSPIGLRVIITLRFCHELNQIPSTQTSTKSLFITIEYVFLHTLFLFLFCYSANINSGFNTNSKNHSHFICDFIFGGLSVTNENYHNNDGNKTDGFTVQGLYDTVFFSPFFQQVRISLTFFLYRILHIENVIANNYYMVAQLRFFFFSLVVV